jgi:L-asparagine transporter-like permease
MTTTLTLRVLLFYLASMTLIMGTVAWNTIKPGTSPFVAALIEIGIPGAGLAMNIVVLTAVLSCLNSGLYVTSRVLFALAANGDAPQALVKLNRRKVPARAILTGSAFGYAALIASVVSPSGVFSFLMIGAAQIQNRKAMTKAELENLPLRMWLFPYLSYAAEAGILAVLIAMAFYPDLSSQLVLTLAFTAFLWLAYALLRKASPAGSGVVKTAKS